MILQQNVKVKMKRSHSQKSCRVNIYLFLCFWVINDCCKCHRWNHQCLNITSFIYKRFWTANDWSTLGNPIWMPPLIFSPKPLKTEPPPPPFIFPHTLKRTETEWKTSCFKQNLQTLTSSQKDWWSQTKPPYPNFLTKRLMESNKTSKP